MNQNKFMFLFLLQFNEHNYKSLKKINLRKLTQVYQKSCFCYAYFLFISK